jgi:uncharacterized membrane protein
MNDFLKYLADILKGLPTEPFAILSLLILVVAVLAFFFFRHASEKKRTLIFILIFAAAFFLGPWCFTRRRH